MRSGRTQHAALGLPQSFQVLSDCFESHYSGTEMIWSRLRKYHKNQCVGWLPPRFWHRPHRASYTARSVAISHRTLYTDHNDRKHSFLCRKQSSWSSWCFQSITGWRRAQRKLNLKAETNVSRRSLRHSAKSQEGARLEGTFGDHLVRSPAQSRISCTRLPKTLHKEVWISSRTETPQPLSLNSQSPSQ